MCFKGLPHSKVTTVLGSWFCSCHPHFTCGENWSTEKWNNLPKITYAEAEGLREATGNRRKERRVEGRAGSREVWSHGLEVMVAKAWSLIHKAALKGTRKQISMGVWGWQVGETCVSTKSMVVPNQRHLKRQEGVSPRKCLLYTSWWNKISKWAGIQFSTLGGAATPGPWAALHGLCS